MKRLLPRWIVAIAAFAILGIALWYAFRPRPVAVDIALVSRGPLEQSVEVEAKTRVRDRYVVAAALPGRVTRLPWIEGERINAGQTVATIDALPSTTAVEQSIAQIRELEQQRAGVETMRPKPEALEQGASRLAAARAAYHAALERRSAASASYAQAVRNAGRAAQLAGRGYLPQSELEHARLAEETSRRELGVASGSVSAAAAAVDTANAELRELQAKRSDPDYLKRVYEARIAAVQSGLRSLQDQASRTVVRAPVSGSVLRVLQKSEQYIPAGTPLLEIGNVEHLEIVADVLSSDAVRMHPGDSIAVLRGAGDRLLRGRVSYVEPAGYTKVSALGIEEQRVNVVGNFVDNPLHLGDQYRLDIRIVTWRTGNAVRAPLSALFRCGNDWCAFYVEGGRAVRSVVKIGHRSDTSAEVISGLRPAQRVIVHPSDRVRDGVPVDTASAQ